MFLNNKEIKNKETKMRNNTNDLTKYFVADYKCIKNPNSDILKIEEEACRTNIFGT